MFDLPVVDHNRDLNSEKGKIDERSRLGVMMKEGILFDLPVVNHNRDLNSTRFGSR